MKTVGTLNITNSLQSPQEFDVKEFDQPRHVIMKVLKNVPFLSFFRVNAIPISKFVALSRLEFCIQIPWVPEPQNLNERKLVRGKERRKKGGSGQMITQPIFHTNEKSSQK